MIFEIKQLVFNVKYTIRSSEPGTRYVTTQVQSDEEDTTAENATEAIETCNQPSISEHTSVPTLNKTLNKKRRLASGNES